MEKKSIMWHYIAEEPEVLNHLMQTEKIREFAYKEGKKIEEIYFVAHGSSYNAAISVSDFMARAAGLKVYAYTPVNFQYNTPILQQGRTEKKMVIAISQTGTSSGVIEVLRCAHRQGFYTLGITDEPESPVAKEADATLLLECGREDSNAKTKGYSATLLLLLLLSVQFGRVRGTLTEETEKEIIAELKDQIAGILQITEKISRWCTDNVFGKELSELYVLGYGMNFGTAMEGQLKLMETMCIPTMFNDIGEFSHGMHRAITEKSSILLMQTNHPLQKLTEETFCYLKGITKHVLMLDATGCFKEEPDRILLPEYPFTQSILLMTLAVQILSVFAPEFQGEDPNRDAHNDFTEFVHTRV